MQSHEIIEQLIEQSESDLAIWSVILPHLMPECVFLFNMVNRIFRKEYDQALYWNLLARDYFPNEFHLSGRRLRLGLPQKTWKQRYAAWCGEYRRYKSRLSREEQLLSLIKEGDIGGLEEEKLEREGFDKSLLSKVVDLAAIGRSQAMRDYVFNLFFSLVAEGKDELSLVERLSREISLNQVDSIKNLFEYVKLDPSIISSKEFRDAWIESLLFVAKGGNVVAVDALLLVAKGANDHHLDFAKVVALYEAIRYGRVEVVKQLLAFGVPVDGLRNLSDGILAFFQQPQEIDKRLWNALRNCNVRASCVRDIAISGHLIPSPLIMATNLGDIDIMKVLLDQGANPNLIMEQLGFGLDPLIQFKKTALNCAIAENDIHAVQLLLDHGVRVDKYGLFEPSSLHFALKTKNKPIINAILKKLLNTNLSAFSPEPLLAEAILLKDDSIISVLLSLQVNLNDSLWRPSAFGGARYTPLSLAAEDKNIALVLVLLDKGAEVKGLRYGNTCYEESHTFFKSLIQLLIDYRYNAAILNDMLYVVAVIGDEELASWLVAVLMTGSRLDTRRLTQAITHADSCQRAGVVALLINALCLCQEVDVKSLNDALYVSVKHSNPELVKRLIHCGANPNYALSFVSVIGLARENGQTAIVDLLFNATIKDLINFIDKRTRKLEGAKTPYAANLGVFHYVVAGDIKLTAAKLFLAFRKGEVSADDLEPYKIELENGTLGDIYRRYTEQDLKHSQQQEARRSYRF